MKLKRIVSLMLCAVTAVAAMCGNPQALLSVQAAEIEEATLESISEEEMSEGIMPDSEEADIEETDTVDIMEADSEDTEVSGETVDEPNSEFDDESKMTDNETSSERVEGVGISSKGNATSLTLGTIQTAILAAEATHWYKFTATGNDSFYRINFTNVNVDCWNGCIIKVYDGNDVELVSFNQGYNSTGYKDIKITEKGTYYIKIYPYYSSTTGKYQVTVSEIKDDVSDTKSGSKVLTLGTTFKGEINAEGDIDWFKFTTTGSNSFYRINLKNVNIDCWNGCIIKVYDGNDVEQDSFRQGNNSAGYKDIKIIVKGTYYIKIYPYDSSATGKYQITVSEIKDDAQDTKDKASTINLNKTYTRQIHAQRDVDWYKFVATGTVKHRIKLQNVNLDSACYVKLYDSDDVLLQTEYAYNNSYVNFDIKLKRNKTYYLEVYSSNSDKTGKYKLTVSNPIINTPTSVKASSKSYNSNKITWNKVSGVSGYQVYAKSSVNSEYKKIATVSSSSTYTHKSLTTGKKYYYKIRAYKKVGNSTYYGSFSGAKTSKPSLEVPSGVSVSKPGYGKAKLSWKKVSGASGYEIRRSTSYYGSYEKIKTISSGSTLSYTNSKLSSGRYYYYKIRAYRTVSGEKVYSGYSSIVYVYTQ